MKTLRRLMAVAAVGMGCGGLAQCGKPPALDKETRYTCPMHPEVVSNAPGTCPKCGMALVPQETETAPDGKAKR